MVQVDRYKVVMAAGGTGGHIFPAEALAERLIALEHQAYLVTDSRFSSYGKSSAQGVFSKIPIYTVRTGKLGTSLLTRIRGLFEIVIGIFQAFCMLRKIRPHVVVGFGGYPSFPTMMAASIMGIPTVIHEQNAVLGKANRLLASRVGVIATSFARTEMIDADDQQKVVVTGNPVRAAVCVVHEIPYSELGADGVMRILITGGSQGASVFSDVVPRAIALLPPNLRARLRIDQQCRDADLKATQSAYQALGMNVDVATFFYDVPARLAAAHLVIARSGASTVCELSAAGRPAILVPLPTSADNHQYMNANAFEEAGGGWVMPQEGFTPEALASKLESFLHLPVSLVKAARSSHAMARRDAANDLAALSLLVARGDRMLYQKNILVQSEEKQHD